MQRRLSVPARVRASSITFDGPAADVIPEDGDERILDAVTAALAGILPPGISADVDVALMVTAST